MAILAAVGLASFAAGAAGAKPPPNPANEHLLKMSAADRAAWLAQIAGPFCVGSEPFYMGTTESGAAAGYAYWSFRCLGMGDYIVQIEPLGHGVAMDCKTFEESAAGRKCFEKF